MQRLTRRTVLTAGLGFAAAAAGVSFWPGGRGGRELKQVDRTAAALGTKIHLTLLHDDEGAADRAADAAFATLDSLENILSIYRPRSQVSILNKEGVWYGPDDELCTVLDAAIAMSKRTNGAFDVSIQPLWRVYAEAQKRGQSPDPHAIAAARKLVDWRKIDVAVDRVTLREPGMALTFNGIAQGHATDRVRETLGWCGIKHALIDVGELAPLGDKRGQPWRAGIQHPRHGDAFIALAALDHRCLATSGDYSNVFDDDKHAGNNHILDPATGQSPREFASVSIAAPSAMMADALSTAVFVVGFERGVDLVRSTPGADAFFVFKDGRTFATDGFPVTRAI